MTASLLLVLAAALPGVCYEQTTRTVVGTSAPGPAIRTRVCSLGRRMRLESAEGPVGSALVLRLDEGRAFRLEPGRRTATTVDLERLRLQSHLDLGVAGQALGPGGDGNVRTVRLDATRTVAGRACSGYRISGPDLVLDLYVADLGPGFGIDAFADFLEWSGASQSLLPLLDEMRRLPGFPLETRMRGRVNGAEVATTATVTRLELGPIDPGLFDIPKGYAVVAEPPSLPED
jgi:hypothetical protein